MEERRNFILAQVTEPDARERLSRIALVKPEKARQIEDMIIRAAQSGGLSSKVDEQKLIQLLEQINVDTILNLAAQSFYSVTHNLHNTPDRLSLSNPKYDSLYMPSNVNEVGESIKLVSIPKNSNGLQSTTVVLEDSNGAAKWVVNSKLLTAIRTAAGSALASNALASVDSKYLVVIGTGVQAYWHVKLLLQVRSGIDSITIFSRSLDSAKKFSKELLAEFPLLKLSAHQLSVNSEAISKPLQLSLSSADIICACTPSKIPFIYGQYLKNGVHLNCIGSYTSEMHEFDLDTIINSQIFVDSIDMTMKEAGELIAAKKNGYDLNLFEMGKFVLRNNDNMSEPQFLFNPVKVGSTKRATLFKSVGAGVQDVVLTKYICMLAEKKQFFTAVPFN